MPRMVEVAVVAFHRPCARTGRIRAGGPGAVPLAGPPRATAGAAMATKGAIVDTGYSYPLLSVFWTLLWFFLFALWFYLLFAVVSDILLSHDLSGWGKAGWIVVAVVFPLFGILIYLIVRGGSMHERAMERAAQQEQALRERVLRNHFPPGGGPADEIGRLAELRDHGAISDEEYQRLKAKVLT
ncbi:hypothetical protein FsymDg_2142 [Candidatus Protofrankia datiscae]|uniref:Integral membrane protein n=1 Tax=Candidatus Protofrankia datiscae TaxID=2716812 RepID=F8AYW5_9ACTN|nr:hypothetical protein FsymDg_2142 [Candidatus Protofrankia datiscae]